MKRNIELLPLVLLCLFTGKLLFTTFWSYQEAIVLCALTALAGLFYVKAKNEELQELKTAMGAQTKRLEDTERKMEALSNSVSGIKLANASKSVPRF